MIQITKKDFFDWIFEQSDEKIFDLKETDYTSSCGCPMVQFGKDKGIIFWYVGFSHWIDEKGLLLAESQGFGAFRLVWRVRERFSNKEVYTYGELKKALQSDYDKISKTS